MNIITEKRIRLELIKNSKYLMYLMKMEINLLTIKLVDINNKYVNLTLDGVIYYYCKIEQDFKYLETNKIVISNSTSLSIYYSNKETNKRNGHTVFSLMVWDVLDRVQPKIIIIAKKLSITGDLQIVNIK